MARSSIKRLLLPLFVALTVVVATVSATGTSTKHRSSHQEHPRHHQHMEKHHMPKSKAEGGSVLTDKELLRDREHLQEDLQGELTPEQISSMSERELEYHYFKVHDFDKNHKLDGLELLAALGHVVQHGDEDDRLDLKHLPMVEEMIDEVFKDGDRNKDGFLTYSEYALGRYNLQD